MMMSHRIYIKDTNEDVLQKMQAQGFNVTTCGECGAVVLQHGLNDEGTLTCDACGFTDDISSFPDLVIVDS